MIIKAPIYTIAFSLVLTSSLSAFADPALNGDRLSHVAGLQAISATGVEAANAMGVAVREQSGLTASSSYSNYNSESDSNRPYKGDVESLRSSLAYVHDFSNFSLGASFGYIEQDLDFKNTNGLGGTLSSEVDGFLLSVGGATELGNFSLSLVGGWGQFETDSRLRNVTGNEKTNYDTHFYFAAATATYRWIENDTYSIAPSLTLGYQNIRTDDFSEIDGAAGTFEQTEYDELEDDVPYVEFALTARYLGCDTLTPYASISVWKDLGDDHVDFSARQVPASGTIPTFQVNREVADTVDVIYSYIIGGELNLTDNIRIAAEAAYFNSDDIEGYRLGLNGNYRF